MNVTLVAYYGTKPDPLVKLIVNLQQKLSQDLHAAFVPYDLDQVHATIIGLEGVCDGAHILNLNYLQCRQEQRPMDVRQVIRFIQNTALLPLTIRIGGYAAHTAYPFTSRGQSPYLRSFSLQGATAVAMGWPVAGETYPATLDRLRRACNSVHVLHKYHTAATDSDNDFFFVLGQITREVLSEADRQEVQDRLRSYMAAQEPLDITVGREHLSVVAYRDPQLPCATSQVYNLDEAKEHSDMIRAAYRRNCAGCSV